VGAPRDARKLLRQLDLERDTRKRLTIVGFVDAAHRTMTRPRHRGKHVALHPRTAPVPVLGGLDRLDELVDSTGATDVIVAVPHRPRRHLQPRLAKFTKSDVAVHWVRVDSGASGLDTIVGRRSGTAGVSPRIRSLRGADLARMAKRLTDVVLGATGLVLLSPLFLVVSLVILVTTGRPIFYSQERVGLRGQRFRIIKFRSMRTDAEQETGPIWASDHDARCTRIGDWLRRTNVDELPQLFNVLKGDMSLVGPRPERPVFVDQFRDSMPDYDLRHSVPCGMTGWAQVHGWRGRTSLRKRIQYDLDYIQRWTFWLDFLILFMTIQHVAWGKTSWKMSRSTRRSEA
jgi:exopolysaccharide biosynthesis polyprenyl glycosylphosphotransferase